MPSYPVLQPNGKLAIWSMAIHRFAAFDLNILDAATKIQERHSTPMLEIMANCVKVKKGQIPYAWMMNWTECLTTALHEYGEDDIDVQTTFSMTDDATAAEVRRAVAEIKQAIAQEQENERLAYWGIQEMIDYHERKLYYFTDLSRVPGDVTQLENVMNQERDERMAEAGITKAQYDHAISLAIVALRKARAKQELTFSPECQLMTPKEQP